MIQLTATDKNGSKPSLSRRAFLVGYDVVGTLIIALTVFAIVTSYFVRIIGVDGASMQPTLQDGDLLMLAVMEDQYRRGDVVVVDRYTYSPLIKRVIAVGGDTLSITTDGQVYLNDKLLKEDYIQGTTVLRDFQGKITVPAGYLFVMGDNRPVSKDSRMDEIGLISVKDVVGKAEFCVWPPKSFGKIAS